MDESVLSEAECVPNVNTVTLAGVVAEVTSEGKGLTRFTLLYDKRWASGHELMPLPICSKIAVTAGHRVLVNGELQTHGARVEVYAYLVEDLSRPRTWAHAPRSRPALAPESSDDPAVRVKAARPARKRAYPKAALEGGFSSN